MDTIKGGSIATDGVVKLTIDSDKIGYIFLPNGTILTTVAGVIDTTYAGIGGSITYYVPKNNMSNISLLNSDVAGNLLYSGLGYLEMISSDNLVSILANMSIGINTQSSASISNIIANSAVNIIAQGCSGLQSIYANSASSIELFSSPLLTILVAPSSINIQAPNCALSAKSIGDILYSAYVDNRVGVNYDFSSGTSVDESSVDLYLTTTYGVTRDVVLALLVTTLGGTVILNSGE